MASIAGSAIRTLAIVLSKFGVALWTATTAAVRAAPALTPKDMVGAALITLDMEEAVTLRTVIYLGSKVSSLISMVTLATQPEAAISALCTAF